MELSNPFFCLPIPSNHHSFCILVRLFILGLTVNLKWSRLIFIIEKIYQALEPFDWIILYHYVRPQLFIMHVITPITVLFEQHWIPHALHAGHTVGGFFMHLYCFKIGNYYITFILHCSPKSVYLTMICFYYHYAMFIFPTRIFQVLQLIFLAVFGAMD